MKLCGDLVLRTVCTPVANITPELSDTMDEMVKMMRMQNGVGLAAPQIGILKRIVVIDIGEGLIELINPEIVAVEGNIKDTEGCLSVPGKYGYVVRPAKVKATALNRDGEKFTIEGEGMLAKAICHELDHLDGIVFVDKVTQYVEVDN